MIRIFLLSLFFSYCAISSFAQEVYYPSCSHPEWFKAVPPVTSETPQWAITMYEDCTNFVKIKKEYEAYYSKTPFQKTLHTQNYKFWRKLVQGHIDDQGQVNLPDPKTLFQESVLKKKASSTSKQMASWTNIGPYETVNFNNGTPEARPTQANIYCLAVAPTNTNIVYASAETGEIFKTTDKGMNWVSVSKDYTIGNMRDLKVDPLDEDIVYGCQGGNLYKTTNGGSTWSIIHTFSGHIEQLAIDSDETNKIFAACSSGLYYSSTSGNSWTLQHAGHVYDVEFKPGVETTLYIAVLNSSINRPEIFKSTNSGSSWTLMDNGYYAGSTQSVATVYGCKIGVTPADPNRIYSAIIANGKAGDNGWIGVYYSLDEGASWQDDSGFDGGPYHSEQFVTEENWYLAGYASGYHQGFYNFDIDVSHTDPDKLWIGTIWFCESGNRGGNMEYIRGSRSLSMHADIQDIDVVGNEIWISSDGGINYSNDECMTVSTRMKGITAADYWGFGQGWNEDTWVGGRYHNGNAAYHENYGPGNTLFLGGAESGTGYVNAFENTKNYHSDIGGRKIPTTYDQNSQGITNLGLYPNESYFHFGYSEVEWHPQYANIVYAGRNNDFYRSMNGGVSFDSISTIPNDGNEVASLRRFEISRDDPNYIFMLVQYSTYNWKLFRSTDGGENFTQLNNPHSNGSWRNLSITLNPFDKNEIWFAAEYSSNGNKVFSSTNAGDSWVSRYTSTIQDVQIKDMIFQASDAGNVVYAMTHNDFYYFDYNNNSWNLFSAGLPASHKGFMILPFYRDDKIRLASAKGIWETPMLRASKIQAMPMLSTDSIYCVRDTLQLESYSIVSHTGTNWTWNISPAPSYISNVNARNPKVVFGNSGSYDVTLTIDNQGNTDTKLVENMIEVQSYCDVDLERSNALKTQANGDYFVANDVNLENITHFTMTGWWKPRGAQEAFAALASSGDWCAHCDDTEGLIFDYFGSKLWYKWPGMADNWGGNSGIDIPLDEWSYAALTITPQGATLYLNDKKFFHSKNLNPGNISSLFVGYGHYSKSFKGEIDEVTIWNRALTDEEIYLMRYLTKEDEVLNDPSLIAYYQFNEILRENEILDHAGTFHGSLTSGALLVESGAPIGSGTSDLLLLNNSTSSYHANQTNTSFYTSDCDSPSGKIVVSHIESEPYIKPETSYENVDEYWVFNVYESSSGFVTIDSLGLNPKNNTFLANLGNANSAVYHSRPIQSDSDNWSPKASAIEIDGSTIHYDRKIQLNAESQITLTNGSSSVENVDLGKPCEADVIAGKALELPGNGGDYASAPALNLNSNTVTMSAWVKADGIQNDWAGILFSRGGSTTCGISCASNNELRYHWNNGEWGWGSGAFLPVNEWAHVAMVLEPSKVTIYLNGEAYTRNANHAIEEFDAPLRIGNDPSSNARTFNGQIEEVVVWNRALYQDEIRALRHLTKEGEIESDPALSLYLQFNEEQGKAYDKSGNNFHSPLNGNASRVESSAPVGGGSSEKLIVNSAGNYASLTGVNLIFNGTGSLPNGEIVISRINQEPYNKPTNGAISKSYWIINNYGANQQFTSLEDISFQDLGNANSNSTAADLRLVYREENDDNTVWSTGYISEHYDFAQDSVNFENGSADSFGQYVVVNMGAKSWIGAVSNDWSDPQNWNGGTIPASSDDVIIPQNVPYFPILDMNVTIKSINLMPGARLVIPDQFHLDF